MALRSRLPEIAARIDAEVEQAVQEAAALIVESAKARVPYETGRLQRSIHAEPDRADPESVTVFAGGKDPDTGEFIWYGHLVEHGHVQDGVTVAPHPFLIPALEENRAQAVALIRDAVHRAAS